VGPDGEEVPAKPNGVRVRVVAVAAAVDAPIGDAGDDIEDTATSTGTDGPGAAAPAFWAAGNG
jgi:hypothetical protein